MKRIIVAIDSFKGCLSSSEANQAAAEGILQAMPDAEIMQVSVSDGGEGWMAAFHSIIGGELIETTVKDPLMRKLPFGILQRAIQKSVPTILIAGRISDKEQLLDAGFSRVECINPPALPLVEAVNPETAKTNIRQTIAKIL